MIADDDDLCLLAPVEPPAEVASRVRRIAVGELSAARGPRWRAVAARGWTAMAVPVAIAVAVAGYLHWAVQAASALYR
jgi:hypothetical protein